MSDHDAKMTTSTVIRETPDSIAEITKSRIEEMDKAKYELPAGPHPTSVSHMHTSWSTPMNVEDRPSNNDSRLRRASFGGNDGKGGPFFASLTRLKRMDTAHIQASFDEQSPYQGRLEKLFRKWVTGRSIPNTNDDLRRRGSS